MKINYPKIQKAISFNPTNAHRKMNIVELSELIKNNDLLVPCFKEQVQFNDSQVISLLHCELFSKAPIASLSFNKIGSNDEVKQFSFVTHHEVNGSRKGKLSLVDGYRRLMINYAIYNDCDCINDIVFDFVKCQFVKITNDKTQWYQIPVKTLFYENQQVLQDYINQKVIAEEQEEVLMLAVQMRVKFLNYFFTVQIAENMTKKEQLEWLDLLN